MSDDFKWVESTSVAQHLSGLPLSPDTVTKLLGNDLVIMPHNQRDGLVFAQETIGLLKHIREQESAITVELAADGIPDKFLLLQSDDIWLPMLAFVSNSSWNVVLNLVASYIFAKITANRSAPPTVHLTILISDEHKKKTKKLSYSGPADGLKKLQGMSANDLFGE